MTITCPSCNSVNECATSVQNAELITPKDGDFGVCIYCGTLLVVESGTYRKMTKPEEFDARINYEQEMQMIDRMVSIYRLKRGLKSV